MKQYEDGYNVNGYSWENETIEYLGDAANLLI